MRRFHQIQFVRHLEVKVEHGTPTNKCCTKVRLPGSVGECGSSSVFKEWWIDEISLELYRGIKAQLLLAVIDVPSYKILRSLHYLLYQSLGYS